jgi:hypothetical protein
MMETMERFTLRAVAGLGLGRKSATASLTPTLVMAMVAGARLTNDEHYLSCCHWHCSFSELKQRLGLLRLTV